MKTLRPIFSERAPVRGFTLMELLIVMVIIAILAALTLGAFRFAQESAARNRTVGTHAAIKAALEQYKEKFGEYPEPSAPEEQASIGDTAFRAGGSKMLYQAITGDGTSSIKLASGTVQTQSNGAIEETERDNVINASVLPKSVIYVTKDGDYLVIDGWSRPFQYSKGDADTLNPTYDLWSFGPLNNQMSVSYGLATKRDPTATATWIKNW